MLNLIESKDNPKVKNALKIATDASYRRKNGVFFASTSKVVLDIIDAGFAHQAVFVLNTEYEKFASRLPADNVYLVSQAVADKLSEGKTEDGVFGVFEMKPADESSIYSAGRLLVLQDIQDPNNMGAIMRTALAFGYENIAISSKCADIYSRKVIRTSMTASVKLNVFRLNVHGDDSMADFVQALNSRGFTTVAACLEGAQELGTVATPAPVALFIGNEGNGLTDDVIANCKLRLKIPMSDRIESLNAAVSAAVLMWELKR